MILKFGPVTINFVQAINLKNQEIFLVSASRGTIKINSSIAGVLSMADGCSHKALVESSTLSPGTLEVAMARMLSRVGYWGTGCSRRCRFCDKPGRWRKTTIRQREKRQWRKEWQG